MENLKRRINAFIIIIIILMSNTMYFGLINRKITLMIFLFSIILILLINKMSVQVNNMIILCIMSTVILVQVLLNSDILDKMYIKNIMENLMFLWLVGISIGYVEKEYFIKIFINVICFFSIISLVFVFIANVIPENADLFYRATEYGSGTYFISPFYMWGIGDIWKRNSGPFWEPGAFQGFINIAILWIITMETNINKVSMKLTLLVLTLLTTQSTTGYILFVLNMIFFGGRILSKYRNNKIMKIAMLGIFILGVTTIFNSNNIEEKFTSKENPSSVIRANDTIDSIKLIGKRPLRGIGGGEFKNIHENMMGIKNNSNGLLLSVYMYGLVVSLFYSYFFIIGIKEKFAQVNNIKKNIIIINFLILYFTEGLVWLPFYIVFLFKFKSTCVEKDRLDMISV